MNKIDVLTAKIHCQSTHYLNLKLEGQTLIKSAKNTNHVSFVNNIFFICSYFDLKIEMHNWDFREITN